MMGFRNGKRHEILQNYRRAKKTTFDFEKIVLFFSHADHADAHQVISYRTLQDLDFEELFMYLDRTCSRIGQQLLYSLLRTIPGNNQRKLKFEKIIKHLDDNPKLKESAVLEISKMNDAGAYFLPGLIYNENIERPKWFWAVPLFSIFSVMNLILSIIFPVFVLLFVPVLIVNFVVHYWNKKNMLTYSNSIPQLLILNQVANRLLQKGVLMDDVDRVRSSVEGIRSLSKSAIFFRIESKVNSEIGQLIEFLTEIIKIFFLLEPVLMYRMIKDLDLKRAEISDLFHAVAAVDVAISISSFREALPYYAIPEVSEGGNSFYASEIFHPLLLKPIANTVTLSDGKSVLISGSNMSGKTTFIRTIGINAILAQTINTVCARELVMPQWRVFSAIKISDDLLDDTSYYYEEVKTIKKLISECASGNTNLFLLDEIFKGTNTVERIASGKAVLSHLSQNGNTVLVSTHDLELIELLRDSYNYYHFSESVENDVLIFDYKLKPGRLTNTNAIRILEINKFPEEITEEAKALALKIKRQKERTIKKE
jgi:hypothetical protein